MWVFAAAVVAMASARTQPGSSPRYHPEILRQSWSSLCEPIFDGELTWCVSRTSHPRFSCPHHLSDYRLLGIPIPGTWEGTAQGSQS